MSDYHILNWDTSFFGFKVAKITSKNLGTVQLEVILDELRVNNFRLVYWAVDYSNELTKISAINMGGLLIDRKVTYSINLDDEDGYEYITSDIISEYDKDWPTPELEELAISSGIYSRFNVDKNLHCYFESLYKTWILRSVQKVISDKVFIANDNKLSGMITLKIHEDRGIIGLFAVDNESRGKGIGVALLKASLEWFKFRRCKFADVVTQMDNKPACKLYEKCGFHVNKAEFFFHFWL